MSCPCHECSVLLLLDGIKSVDGKKQSCRLQEENKSCVPRDEADNLTPFDPPLFKTRWNKTSQWFCAPFLHNILRITQSQNPVYYSFFKPWLSERGLTNNFIPSVNFRLSAWRSQPHISCQKEGKQQQQSAAGGRAAKKQHAWLIGVKLEMEGNIFWSLQWCPRAVLPELIYRNQFLMNTWLYLSLTPTEQNFGAPGAGESGWKREILRNHLENVLSESSSGSLGIEEPISSGPVAQWHRAMTRVQRCHSCQ